MRNKAVCCATMALLSLLCHPILSQDIVVGLIRSANDKAHEKRAKKAAEKYTTFFTTDRGEIPMLRVPVNELKSPASKSIIKAQKMLVGFHESYLLGEHVDIYDDYGRKENFNTISALDSYWRIDLYEEELGFYEKYENELTKKEREEKLKKEREEKRITDSIAHERRMAEIILLDSLERVRMERQRIVDSTYRAERIKQGEINKKRRDKEKYEERMRQYDFVNIESLNLREKPNSNSRKLAKVGACSYVAVMSGPVNGYVEVFVGDYHGYLFAKYLVDRIEQITVESSSLEIAKEMYYTSVESENNSGITDQCHYNGQKLFKGPKGGCFYYSSSGNKVYVERYMCAGCK